MEGLAAGAFFSDCAYLRRRISAQPRVLYKSGCVYGSPACTALSRRTEKAATEAALEKAVVSQAAEIDKRTVGIKRWL